MFHNYVSHSSPLARRGQFLVRRFPVQSVPARSTNTSTSTASPQDLQAAREWLSNFKSETIPRSIGDLSFSRSSGPGGQNVNKVNSKATLRVPLAALLRLVPPILHPNIRASRFYKHGSDAVVIQAEDSRKQSDNSQACFAKLHSLILEVAAKAVPGETPDAQKERVKGLQKAANEQRLRSKMLQSSKKAARKGGQE